MGYDIYVSDKNKTKVLKLPIIPTELPFITKSISNEEFETYNNGSFNFIQDTGLDTLTLDCWLPVKSYPFLKSDVKVEEIINLINNALNAKECIQIVIIKSDGSTYINDKFSIESFEYNILKRGDYSYSLGLKKYREYSKEVYTLGWNEDATGWWYCTGIDPMVYFKNCWQNIDTQWYYFCDTGYALHDAWFLWKNTWYYFRSNCQMCYSEWKKISGRWYCFAESGALYVNCITPDGYRVDSTGALM